MKAKNRAEEQEAVKELLGKIRTEWPEVERIFVQYGGEGDDGGIQRVEYWIKGANHPSDDPRYNKWDTPLRSEVYDITDEIIDSRYGGYYNNEGGGGTVEFNVVNGKVTIAHYWYETTTVPEATIEIL